MVQLIHVAAHRGDGSVTNPERIINLYFSPSGQLMACHDPLNGPVDGFLPLSAGDAPA
ncbi:hypothetical protein [Pseudomonas oryzihabitans]|uniref:hypothetical protein n=1 Tax=Pseudomonas oryzihabitans TaxID=47885 RepID=UPI0028A78FF3|nr:hypothetical protein [Pseudomonas oryzihabitans]